MSKMASIMTHPDLEQGLHGAINEDHVTPLLSWLVWGCKSARPKEENVRTSPFMMADYGRDLGYIARGENEACCLC